MGLFRNSGQELRAVVDFGSRSIRGVVFSAPEKPGAGPKILKKTVLELPPSGDGARSVLKLNEFISALVKTVGKIPLKITVSLGPQLGELSLSAWRVTPVGKPSGGILPKDLKGYFENLFEQRREVGEALIAYPLDILVNGYSAGEVIKNYGKRENELRRFFPRVNEIAFRTLLLRLPDEIGIGLFAVKKSLVGIPIEFVSRLAAYNRLLPSVLRQANALVIEAGETETALNLFKDGKLASFYILPVGAKDGELWQKMFLEAREIFFPSGPLPSDVFLAGDSSTISRITPILKNTDWLKDFSYASSPQIKILEAQNVFEGDTLGGSVRGPEELALSSAIHYSLYHQPLF